MLEDIDVQGAEVAGGADGVGVLFWTTLRLKFDSAKNLIEFIGMACERCLKFFVIRRCAGPSFVFPNPDCCTILFGEFSQFLLVVAFDRLSNFVFWICSCAN